MPTRRAGLTLLILACVALVPNAESHAARPGNRVRLVESITNPALVVGQSVRLANDSALLRSDSSSFTQPAQLFELGSPHRLEQRTGVRHRTLWDMGIGLHAGAAPVRVGEP